MAICYLDTCALKHRYTKGPKRALIDELVENKSNECYIADLTVLEMAHALGASCRERRDGVRRYDAMDRRFWMDINDGGLSVWSGTGLAGILKARALLRFGGVLRGGALGSGDALIASCGLDLAHWKSQRICFYTADWNLYKILRGIDAYKAAMRLEYILTPKDSAIPPVT